jgi:lipocalin
MNILNIIFLIKAYQLCSNIFLEYFEFAKNIDYNKYIGKWYEVYISEFKQLNDKTMIEKCVIHDYNLINKEYNYKKCSDKMNIIKKYINIDNVYEENNGILCNENDDIGNGKLSLYMKYNYISKPYWIIKLGEEKNGKYQYSIISTPFKSSLIVLVRDLNDFENVYKKEIVEYLDYYNFNYIQINQTNCI